MFDTEEVAGSNPVVSRLIQMLSVLTFSFHDQLGCHRVREGDFSVQNPFRPLLCIASQAISSCSDLHWGKSHDTVPFAYLKSSTSIEASGNRGPVGKFFDKSLIMPSAFVPPLQEG